MEHNYIREIIRESCWSKEERKLNDHMPKKGKIESSGKPRICWSNTQMVDICCEAGNSVLPENQGKRTEVCAKPTSLTDDGASCTRDKLADVTAYVRSCLSSGSAKLRSSISRSSSSWK